MYCKEFSSKSIDPNNEFFTKQHPYTQAALLSSGKYTFMPFQAIMKLGVFFFGVAPSSLVLDTFGKETNFPIVVLDKVNVSPVLFWITHYSDSTEGAYLETAISPYVVVNNVTIDGSMKGEPFIVKYRDDYSFLQNVLLTTNIGSQLHIRLYLNQSGPIISGRETWGLNKWPEPIRIQMSTDNLSNNLQFSVNRNGMDVMKGNVKLFNERINKKIKKEGLLQQPINHKQIVVTGNQIAPHFGFSYAYGGNVNGREFNSTTDSLYFNNNDEFFSSLLLKMNWKPLIVTQMNDVCVALDPPTNLQLF
ncbi:hypothetical protein ABK040_013175 [Willaertia magna]